jgi:hypothetical protein
MIAMFVPFLSILGVTLVSLNPVPVSKVNRQVLFGGLIFALFVVTMGYDPSTSICHHCKDAPTDGMAR